MTPFPESEIIIIKRLEVALKKADYVLLKSGAYKLHEKYHSGHIFEYIDSLKEIKKEVVDNFSIPSEIKEILIPTINDILETQTQYSNTGATHHVSSLTSLSYETQSSNHSVQNPIEQNYAAQTISQEVQDSVSEFQINQEKINEENKSEVVINAQNSEIIDEQQKESTLNAFEVFSAPRPVGENFQERTIVQSPFSAQPFKEFTSATNDIGMAEKQPPIIEQIQSAYNNVIQNNKIENTSDAFLPKEEEKQLKSVAIFYGQDLSNEKIKNVLKYRKLLSETSCEQVYLTELLELISELNTQSNTNVVELKSLLEQLKIKQNQVNLITNSQSSHLINLLEVSDISYSIFNPSSEKRINLLPLLGLSNLFKCSDCNQEYLDLNEDITPFVLQCPQCKKPMYPVFYTTCGDRSEINMDYYNSSIITLANSKVWLLIHPLLNEKITLNMLRSALKVSSEVEEIFILDRDINVRDQFRKIFSDINPDVKINTNLTMLEDFFNLINGGK